MATQSKIIPDSLYLLDDVQLFEDPESFSFKPTPIAERHTPQDWDLATEFRPDRGRFHPKKVVVYNLDIDMTKMGDAQKATVKDVLERAFASGPVHRFVTRFDIQEVFDTEAGQQRYWVPREVHNETGLEPTVTLEDVELTPGNTNLLIDLKLKGAISDSFEGVVNYIGNGATWPTSGTLRMGSYFKNNERGEEVTFSAHTQAVDGNFFIGASGRGVNGTTARGFRADTPLSDVSVASLPGAAEVNVHTLSGLIALGDLPAGQLNGLVVQYVPVHKFFIESMDYAQQGQLLLDQRLSFVEAGGRA